MVQKFSRRPTSFDGGFKRADGFLNSRGTAGICRQRPRTCHRRSGRQQRLQSQTKTRQRKTPPYLAQQRHKSKKLFQQRPHGKTMRSLGDVKNRQAKQINWKQSRANGPKIRPDFAAQNPLRRIDHSPRKYSDVNDESRIDQLPNHFARRLRSLPIKLGQQTKANVETPASLSRIQKRQVKSGKPSSDAGRRFCEGGTLLQTIHQLRNLPGKRAEDFGSVQRFQTLNETEAGLSHHPHLMIELRLPLHLPRRGNQSFPSWRAALVFRVFTSHTASSRSRFVGLAPFLSCKDPLTPANAAIVDAPNHRRTARYASVAIAQTLPLNVRV